MMVVVVVVVILFCRLFAPSLWAGGVEAFVTGEREEHVAERAKKCQSEDITEDISQVRRHALGIRWRLVVERAVGGG